jgi:hypothetical protein
MLPGGDQRYRVVVQLVELGWSKLLRLDDHSSLTATLDRVRRARDPSGSLLTGLSGRG